MSQTKPSYHVHHKFQCLRKQAGGQRSIQFRPDTSSSGRKEPFQDTYRRTGREFWVESNLVSSLSFCTSIEEPEEHFQSLEDVVTERTHRFFYHARTSFCTLLARSFTGKTKLRFQARTIFDPFQTAKTRQPLIFAFPFLAREGFIPWGPFLDE